MKRVLITGAGSYIGTKVQQWLEQWPEEFKVDAVDTINDNWKKADFSQYDVVYNVAGIAHVKAAKGEGPLYYAINRDMIINIAKTAKEAGVKQFIHMSSMIVYKEVKTLEGKQIHNDTEPVPNGFYGDSKLQGEIGVREQACDTFKVCIMRPPMIYILAARETSLVWYGWHRRPLFSLLGTINVRCSISTTSASL
ncbi:sugar nucleotide-binding protein [Bacteroides salyersiae]|nr:sugar nucleotide-binding protein [Bacteroides salyersiae]